MSRHVRPANICTRLLVAAVLVTSVTAAVATPATAATQPVTDTGSATAVAATVSGAMAAPQVVKPVRPDAVLGRDGKAAGAELPSATPSSTARPGPTRGSGTINTAKSAKSSAARATAAAAASSPDIQGAGQGNSGCASCATPDVTAAVNSTEIAETVNLRLQVFTKSGTSLCTVSLPSLLGATSQLAGPRIQYDNANKRFSMVIDTVPSSSGDVAVQYLATSQTDDACGAWWIYSTIFQVSADYPLGALLDFPELGQDNTSILVSTNNFDFTGKFLGANAYAIPKSVLYTGDPVSFNTYSVAFSTAPVQVAGIPVASTTTTYWLAAVPGTGYDLYSMPTNPAGAISLQATISAPFNAPSRRIRQPGTSDTLDPLDGRIGSPAVQANGIVWFANDVDDQGFPTVRYGAINVANDQIETALAFHDTTSDDFNPSIGVSPASSTTDNVWVNWAYTDSPNGVATSDAVAGVAPGQGVPDLAGVDLTLVNGSATTTNTEFGRYSSVAIDPSGTSSCPAGLTALSAQEFFSGNQWTTELARTTFC